MNKLIYMLIQRFVIVLVTILTSAGLLHAQQPASDMERLKGEWVIEKVETQLFAQQGNQLLEEKTYTSPDSINKINGFVPLNIKFREQDCTIKHKAGIEAGSYVVVKNGVLQYQRAAMQPPSQPQPQQPSIPAVSYTYRLPQSSELVLNMPAAFYKDNNRKLAVKLVYTCYYQKK